MTNKKIVLLGGHGLSTRIVYNALAKDFLITNVVIEEKENLKLFIKRRIKRLGLITVIGQIAFQVIVAKVLTVVSRSRRDQILQENGLLLIPIPFSKITEVRSINENSVEVLLNTLSPDLVVVSGTRIISKKIIHSCSAKFLNIHAGITPKYRGVHGMYWALVNNDKENCGVTVHLIDEGIDTGKIIGQTLIQPKPNDNFSTYPILQLAAGIKILRKAVNDIFEQKPTLIPTHNESKLWYHPTIWGYCFNRIFRKVK